MKNRITKIYGYLTIILGTSLITSVSASHAGSGIHFDGISPLVAVAILGSFIALKLKQKK